MSGQKTVHVYADWDGLKGPRLMGQLNTSVVRGKEVLSFEYERGWLQGGPQLLVLDPQLQLVEGLQHGDAPFSLFLDSAPDRWGRLLIERREAHRARQEGRRPEQLLDTDYLLAVSDETRMGGLRFKLDREGAFQGEDGGLAVPPLQALRKLEQASLAFETADADNPRYLDWLNLLLAPGTSLGGARPKSSVVDPDRNLWIAKFPSCHDNFDTGAWEAVTYQLAAAAGLRVAEARAEAFSNAGHTFLIKRFDRRGVTRIHFASAMTLLGHRDGDGSSTGLSYLELAEFIETAGEAVEEDLEELWSRIAFNICVGNSDDHLRNHGFLLGERGWRLSPLFDVNPHPWATGLALNIDESSNALDFDLVREVAPYFRIKPSRRDTILQRVQSAASQWESIATKSGIPRSEITQVRPAFERD